MESVLNTGAWRLGLAKDVIDRVNLITVHGVSHSCVDALVDVRVHSSKHLRGLSYPLQRDMWILITAAQEHGRLSERPYVVARPR